MCYNVTMSETFAPHILHPEHFTTPFLGEAFARNLAIQSAQFEAKHDVDQHPAVSVVIRTRNDEAQLESLFEDFANQVGSTDTQYIVVDTNSTDRTADVARSNGASVVSISQTEFSYPEALNRGFERAENPVVFSTVGHVALATNVLIAAGASHFSDRKVGGVFVPPLPASWASATENVMSLGNAGFIGKAKPIKRAGLGVMGATNAMFNREAWEELDNFDLKFAAGGEDTELARTMIDAGYSIMREPLVSVHHAHGLKLANYARQFKHWLHVAGKPGAFDAGEVLARRPDLSAKF